MNSHLNPQIAEIHTDFLRAMLLSVICEDLRNLPIIRQAVTGLAFPYRFADLIFAFSVSVSRSRGGALETSDSRR